MLKRTWAEIDISALKHNFEYIKKASGNTEIYSVVKTDAYGHGAGITVPVLDNAGSNGFCVSNIQEAIELRNLGLHKPILILGYTPVESVKEIYDNDIIQCVYSEEYAQMLSNAAINCGVKIKVYIKLDTGMGRIGFDCRSDELFEIEKAIEVAKLDGFITLGAFMHFAVSDRDIKNDDGFTNKQYSLFIKAKEKFESAGLTLKYSCQNSAAIFNDSDKKCDISRPGIILYGLSPDNSEEKDSPLIPVMTLKSVISNVKNIRAGETVSYGRTFKAEKNMKIATVSAGYGDGYPRALSNKGFVFINGTYAPILGRVCMDQFMIDVTNINVKIGDTVILFGKELSVSVLAQLSGTINYEIVCGINKRVPKITVKGDLK